MLLRSMYYSRNTRTYKSVGTGLQRKTYFLIPQFLNLKAKQNLNYLNLNKETIDNDSFIKKKKKVFLNLFLN